MGPLGSSDRGVFIHLVHVHKNYNTWVGDRRRVNCAFVNHWLDLTEELRGVVKTVAEDWRRGYEQKFGCMELQEDSEENLEAIITRLQL